MCLFIIDLDIDEDYKKLIKQIYKIFIVLIVFQILIYYSALPKDIISQALSGSLLNDNFMTLVLFVIIGILAYNLVFKKIVTIK
jgi:hypothetical protein